MASVFEAVEKGRKDVSEAAVHAKSTVMGHWATLVARVVEARDELHKKAERAAEPIVRPISAQIARIAAKALKTSQELKASGAEIVSQKSFQVTATSTVGGAVVVGSGSGAVGAAAGGMLGAAAGLPLALFTFGLSVPVGATIGGGTGLVAGATTGATAGAIGGGAVGYGTYQKWDDIQSVAQAASAKAISGKDQVMAKAQKSVDYACGVASATRAKIVGARAGGKKTD